MQLTDYSQLNSLIKQKDLLHWMEERSLDCIPPENYQNPDLSFTIYAFILYYLLKNIASLLLQEPTGASH